MKRKYMITGLVIGLQLVSGYSYVTDASWLSKTWDRHKCSETVLRLAES